MKLQLKILALALPLAILSGVLVNWFARRAIHGVLLDQAARRGVLMGGELASSAKSKMTPDRRAELNRLLAEGLHSSGAVYIFTVDERGNVLAHTNGAERGKTYQDPVTLQALNAAGPLWRPVNAGASLVMDVSMPVRDDAGAPLGVLRLGLPLLETLETEQKLLRQVQVLMLLIGGATLVLALLLLRQILLPVRYLAQATRRLAVGDLGDTVPVLSDDEMGDLARSFNRMSQDLARTTVSKEYLDSILENLLEALFVLGVDGAVRSMNRAALEMLGYTAEEAVGKQADYFFAESDRRTLEMHLAKTDQDEKTRNLELSLMAKTGERIPVLFSASAFHDKRGRLVGVIGVARDIRERMALRRNEEQLRQGQRLEAVGRLAGSVAQELTNPLSIIMGFTQSLLSRLKNEDETARPLVNIAREAARSQELVHGLRLYAESATTEKKEFLDLSATIRQALTLLSGKSKAGRVELKTMFEEKLPRISANRSQVQQVVINLCVNAIDAMPKGGTLTVRTARRDKAAVLMEVGDTGEGIPENLRPRIFQPFVTTKPVGHGTGLGLAIAKEIVDKHGGVLEFDTEEGRGTVFRVLWPAPKGLKDAK